jgi:uncharacterized protein
VPLTVPTQPAPTMAIPANTAKIFVFILPQRQPKPPFASSFLRDSTNSSESASFEVVSANKLEQLRRLLRGYGSCLVAYSGGVDSAFLACVAQETLGEQFLAVIADSPSLPRRELADALALAARFSFPVQVIQTKEFENQDYTANPANRCYFCKHELFEQLASLARAGHFAVIAYGENASDAGDFRPGARAASEFQVRAPLKEAGLTKAEIRQLSAQLGLPTADKPQMACLSSRVPHGEPVTPEKLAMIEQAENVLRDLGFHDVRVRHHELGVAGGQWQVTGTQEVADNQRAARHPSPVTCLARIELGPAEIPRFWANGISTRVVAALTDLGYTHVTLDLQGYRRGSLNEVASSSFTFHALHPDEQRGV